MVSKENGSVEPKKCVNKISRKYDIVDLMLVSVFDILIFSAGLGLGWFVWNK